ncbi:ribosomal L1 domain-containing protein 1-like isoform X1 [Monodelphis domestica]|uniref:ribosomal L1 domain-containing protein 1-like n=1 Tax=Monodelphis domestica TaxID=13616 RepID=UPI0000F2B42E|nr:ribosomal L1 domain-containing protein 1-like [Monodelphis domestica]XP_007498674.1 ribosomal L1 domain-containing protein 1-like isoform X1 [Monodelphis domestica]
MDGQAGEKTEPNLVSHEQIKKATEALLSYTKKKQNDNTLLLNENENVFLMVTLWKIPPKGKEIKIPLPHGIRSDSKDICLFTKDESNLTSEQTEHFYKQLLKKKGITSITEVIPYKRLKQEYKPYEAKRRLLNSFDLFLADQRIRRLLPSHIGKHFYRRKRVPLAVDLTTQNLLEHINKIVQGTTLTVTNHGCCNTTRVGHTGMPVDHLVENTVAAIKVLSEKLPMKWESVKILHLKTEKSLSLPIFSSFVSHLGTHKKTKKQNQGKKVTSKPDQNAVRPDGEGNLEGHGLEATKDGKTEPDSEDEIPQLVPIQATSPQKCPEKIALIKESTGENLSPETPQAKTRGKKRKASMALETSKQIKKGSTQLKKTPTTGKVRSQGPIPKKTQKENNSSLEVKALEKTPKKPQPKSFTHNKVGKIMKSAPKAPQTPRQKQKKTKVTPKST